MNPRDLLLKIGSVSVAAGALLGLSPAQAEPVKEATSPDTSVSAARLAAGARTIETLKKRGRKFTLVPGERVLMFAKGHRSHSSHRSHRSHVSGSYIRGGGSSRGTGGGYQGTGDSAFPGSGGGYPGSGAGGVYPPSGTYPSPTRGHLRKSPGYPDGPILSGSDAPFVEVRNTPRAAPPPPDPALKRVWTTRDQQTRIEWTRERPQLPEATILSRFEQLLTAIRQNDQAAVYRLVAADSSLLQLINIDGYTALHVAAQYGRHVLVRFLLDQGAAIHARSTEGQQPIDLVPVSEQADSPFYATLEVLLTRGASPDGGTVLPPLARFILDLPSSQGGQDESTSEAGVAVRQAVKLLAKHQADLNCVDDQGNTLLLTAVRRKHYALATLLLTLGADAKQVNEAGQSALHLLATVGVGSRSYAVADQLLKAGLSLSQKDSKGKTPLEAAKGAGNTGLATYLKKKGARPTAAPADQSILT